MDEFAHTRPTGTVEWQKSLSFSCSHQSSPLTLRVPVLSFRYGPAAAETRLRICRYRYSVQATNHRIIGIIQAITGFELLKRLLPDRTRELRTVQVFLRLRPPWIYLSMLGGIFVSDHWSRGQEKYRGGSGNRVAAAPINHPVGKPSAWN
jgi:hypothetical protein